MKATKGHQKHTSCPLGNEKKLHLNEDMVSNPGKKRFDMMAINMKLLFYTGCLPSEEIRKSHKGIIMYHIYNILLHAIYLPTLWLQIHTFLRNWGNMVVMLDNISVLCISFIGFLPPLKIRWNKAYDTIYKMQTNSIFTKTSTQNDSKKKKIILQAHRKSWISTMFGLIFILIVLSGIIMEPVFINFMKSFLEENNMLNNFNVTVDFDFDKIIFPFNVQTPFDTSSIMVYLGVYLLIIIGTVILAMKVVVTVTFLYSSITYVSTQFTIVATSLENIDNMVENNSKHFSKSDKQEITRSSNMKSVSNDFEAITENINLIDDNTGLEELVESIKEHQDAIK